MPYSEKVRSMPTTSTANQMNANQMNARKIKDGMSYNLKIVMGLWDWICATQGRVSAVFCRARWLIYLVLI